MAIELARRYEKISAKAYEHPADRAATSALHSVPLLDKVIKRLTDLGHERRLRQIVMGNAVRIGDEQMPSLWADYIRCSSVLDLPATPDLYVTNDPVVNAMTIGAKTPIVIVRSSLVGSYDGQRNPDRPGPRTRSCPVGALLLHDCAGPPQTVHRGRPPQVASPGPPGPRHVSGPSRVGTGRRTLRRPGRGAGHGRSPGAVPGAHANRRWGTAGHELRRLPQAGSDYEGEDDLFSRHSRFWVELSLTHPIAVRRVKEMIEWVQSGDYNRIVDGELPPPGSGAGAFGGVRLPRWSTTAERFSRFLDRTAGSVQDLGKKFGDWLNKTAPDQNGGDADSG